MTVAIDPATIQGLVASGAILFDFIEQCIKAAADIANGVPGAVQAAMPLLQKPPIPQLLGQIVPPPVIDDMQVPAPAGPQLTWAQISDLGKQMTDAVAIGKYFDGLAMALTIIQMAGGTL